MTQVNVAGGGFTTEVFSKKINISLNDHGKYTDVVNRKWEGEIKNQGDRVYIYTLNNLKVSDYTPNATGFTGIEYENPTGDKQALVVDQAKYISFHVDDIREVQSNIELVNQYVKKIAISGAQTKDSYIQSLAVANATTKRHTDAALALTKDNIWGEICAMGAILERGNALINGVDYSGKRPALMVTPEVAGIIYQMPQFFANAVGAEVLRKGQVGKLGMFDVFVTTNSKTDKEGTGSAAVLSQMMVALTSDAIAYAEQINKTETIKDKDRFGDYVRCLMLYGAKVVNPDCIVTSKVTFTGITE